MFVASLIFLNGNHFFTCNEESLLLCIQVAGCNWSFPVQLTNRSKSPGPPPEPRLLSCSKFHVDAGVCLVLFIWEITETLLYSESGFISCFSHCCAKQPRSTYGRKGLFLPSLRAQPLRAGDPERDMHWHSAPVSLFIHLRMQTLEECRTVNSAVKT